MRKKRKTNSSLVVGSNMQHIQKTEMSFKVPLRLKDIKPRTKNQQLTFDYFDEEKNLFLYGSAGTGKTMIALYLALDEVLSKESIFERVLIIRSTVPSRETGFLPGKLEEKIQPYEAPYIALCCELFNKENAYDLLKERDKIDFISTSYIRGVTIRNSIVIVDECQNCTGEELNTIITRMGDNCQVIFCGDMRQTDLTSSRGRDTSGFLVFLKIIERMSTFKTIEFTTDDIQRSGLVKEYIQMKERLEDAEHLRLTVY